MAERDRITEIGERVEALREESVKARTDAASLATVVRENIVNQRLINGKLDRFMDDHETRLRKLETFQTEITTRVPSRLISAEKIEEHLKLQDAKIDGIKGTLAKWGGVIALVGGIAQLTGPPLIKLLFGGGS